MGKGGQPGCCLCKPEGAVVMGIFDRVYLVVDNMFYLCMFGSHHHLIILSCIVQTLG